MNPFCTHIMVSLLRQHKQNNHSLFLFHHCDEENALDETDAWTSTSRPSVASAAGVIAVVFVGAFVKALIEALSGAGVGRVGIALSSSSPSSSAFSSSLTSMISSSAFAFGRFFDFSEVGVSSLHDLLFGELEEEEEA